MHRFLVSPHAVQGDRVILEDPEQLHHLRNVLRIRTGQSVECFDGEGSGYIGSVVASEPRSVVVAIDRRVSDTSPGVAVTLAQSLIKPKRFDWFLQKAAELGAHTIVPLITERTVTRPGSTSKTPREERWRRILEEASKQCGRTSVPHLASGCEFDNFVEQPREGTLLIPTLSEDTRPLKQVLQDRAVEMPLTVMIGPEGDFTPEEVRKAESQGAQAVSLGDLTLRSETAGIAILAILQYEFSKG